MNSDLTALGHLMDRAQHSLFRLETLDHYDVGSDGNDFQRYLRGEDGPDMVRKGVWHKTLEGYRDRGVSVSRVHVVTQPLTDYLRYEFDWGYAYNLGHEDIRILDVTQQPAPPELDGIGDFWLVDGREAAIMHYDTAGRYLGFDTAPPAESRRYPAAADLAWRLAVPFTDYRAGRRVA